MSDKDNSNIEDDSINQLINNQTEELPHMFQVIKSKKTISKEEILQISNSQSLISDNNNITDEEHNKIKLNQRSSDLSNSKKSNYDEKEQLSSRRNNNLPNKASAFKRFSIASSFRGKTGLIKKAEETREDVLYQIVEDIHSKSSYGLNNSLSKKLRYLLTSLVSLNILLSIIDNEIYISKTNDFLSGYMETKNIKFMTKAVLQYMDERELTSLENGIRYANGLLVLVCAIIIIVLFNKKAERLRLSGLLSNNEGLFNKLLFKSFILEILLCLIYLPPYINLVFTGEFQNTYWSYSLNSIISLTIMLKVYFLLKLMSKTSRWTTDSASTICRKYHVRTGLVFAIKCDIKKRPFLVLGIMMGFVILVCSFTIRTFEFGVKEFTDTKFIGNNPFQNLNNCVYFIFFTMTTVGYGDFVPKSLLGRIIAILSMIVGNIILALIIASLSVLSEFNNGEKKAYSKLKKIFAVDNAMIKAGSVIKSVIFLRGVLNKNRNGNSLDLELEVRVRNLTTKFVTLTQLKRDVSIFKNDFKIAKSLSLPLDETLKHIENQIKSNINIFKKEIERYNEAENSIKQILNQSIQCKDQLREILKMQESIAEYLIENNNYSLMLNNHNPDKQEKYIDNDEMQQGNTLSVENISASSGENIPSEQSESIN